MPTTDEIIEFLKDLSGADKVEPNSDIGNDLGMDGDDFSEMIEKYSSKYSVDMTNYLWYFHHADEGSFNNIGGLFFDPPYKRVQRIPLTPSMLTDFANRGKWVIQYPDHKIPTKRYDMLVNQIIIGLVLVFILVTVISKWLN